MKWTIRYCPVCAKSGNREMQQVSIADEGIYVSECSKGHHFAFAHQLLKFYILFEVGAHAIADGYYREAVVNFCSSLERFYELYFRAICLKHGLPLEEGQPLPPLNKQGIPREEVEKAWRQLDRWSERQFGAFVAAYVIENKAAPKPIQTGNLPFKVKDKEGKLQPKPFQSFRNDVVHNGYIPTRSQALEFGQVVLDFISTSNIEESLLNKMETIEAHLQFEALHKLGQDGRVDKDATYAIATGTIMMGSVKGGRPHALDRYVAALERDRKGLGRDVGHPETQ